MARITLQGFQCERCGHKWVPREDETPRVCPKCKSPYWDRPRRIIERNLRTVGKKETRLISEMIRKKQSNLLSKN
jgi:NADH pyrophosphatase NudC (nudix superfamily)